MCMANQLSKFEAHVHYRKCATVECIVSPLNTVCVTALPCKILILTLFVFTSVHCCMPFFNYRNNCGFFVRHFIEITSETVIQDDFYKVIAVKEKGVGFLDHSVHIGNSTWQQALVST